MTVPGIGGLRGIFDIFVPGVFLLFNVAAIVYFFPYNDSDTSQIVGKVLSNSGVSIILVISFGYLFGVILRLFRTSRVDRLSKNWILKHDPSSAFAKDDFPYSASLLERCEVTLPPRACDFYRQVWAVQKTKKRDLLFFDVCKWLVGSFDERAAKEIQAAEALTRHIASMFYALMIAATGFSITITLMAVARLTHSGSMGRGVSLICVLLAVYVAALFGIVQNFRYIRMYEVEMVFTLAFRHRKTLQTELGSME